MREKYVKTKGVTHISSAKQIKKTARERLFADYGPFLFSTLFFTALSFGFTLMSKTLCELICLSLSEEAYVTVSLTFDIIGFLICFPFFAGYIAFCRKKTNGEKAELSELLGFYSGQKLGECIVFLLRKIPEAFLKLVLPFVLLFAIIGYTPGYFAEEFPEAFSAFEAYLPVLYFVLEILAVLLVLYFTAGMILSLFAFTDGSGYRFTFSDRKSFFGLLLSMLPLYLLSVFTFGVLFIAYTVPYTVAVCSVFVSVRNGTGINNNTQSPIDIGDTAIFDISKTRRENK